MSTCAETSHFFLMALVPGLNIGVGILVLIILWVISLLTVIALAAVPKARFARLRESDGLLKV